MQKKQSCNLINLQKKQVEEHIQNIKIDTNFDRSKISLALKLQSIELPNIKCREFQNKLKKNHLLLNIPRIRSIVDNHPITCIPPHIKEEECIYNKEIYKKDNNKNYKRILLNILSNKEENNDTKKYVYFNSPDKIITLDTLYNVIGIKTIQEHTLILHYEYFNMDEILQVILPSDIVIPTAFITIGHIAQQNLQQQQLPYKYLIGKILLEKNHAIRTVVNKLQNIHNTFRTVEMEIIAGEDNTYTSVREHDCIFDMDYSKVYWNSRLQTEHQRLTYICNTMHKFTNEIFHYKNTLNSKHFNVNVLDLFCGIGPFAIPCAKSKCFVYGMYQRYMIIIITIIKYHYLYTTYSKRFEPYMHKIFRK